MHVTACVITAVMFFGMFQSQPQSSEIAAAQADAEQQQDKPAVPAGKDKPKARKQGLAPGFSLEQITLKDGAVYKYSLFVPPQYDWNSTHKWPVILFLHGSGEVGEDGRKQMKFGLPARIGTRTNRFPFITIFPQAHTMWWREKDAQAAWAMLDAVMSKYRTDPDRVYLTGLSMGGFGAWEFACAYPDRFAAIVPVCGAGPVEFMSNIVNVPIWAFHGEDDPNVPVEKSRQLVAELERLGGHPKYTEYKKVGHNSWDRAYAEPELYRWLLQQRRPAPPKVIDFKMPGRVAQVWWLGLEAVPQPKEAPHVHAEILDDGRVIVTSTGIAAFQLKSEAEPLEPGRTIEINWNGVDVFKGTFEGMMIIRPKDASALPDSGEQE